MPSFLWTVVYQRKLIHAHHSPNPFHNIRRYFEFELVTDGPMRVGWARVDCKPGSQLGSDENSWAFDGYNVSETIYYVRIILS